MRPAYLGVVASRKRFAVLRQTLIDRGVSAHALDAIRSPAGLDLGGRQPEEVALSILAEIVQLKHAARTAVAPAAVQEPDIAPTTALESGVPDEGDDRGPRATSARGTAGPGTSATRAARTSSSPIRGVSLDPPSAGAVR